MRSLSVSLAAWLVLAGAVRCASADEGWEAAFVENVLRDGDGLSSWSAAYNRLFDLDADADEAWAGIGTAAELDARREAMRGRMVALIGGFPAERTPLNARVTGTLRRDGYRVECVVFESRPGAYVTGNLYLPEGAPAPYRAVIEVCGHSATGKNAVKYQRIAVLAAKCGLAAFVVDPLCQGERAQCEEDLDGRTTSAHLRLGVNAALLGHGLASFEMWDAVRALDYLDTRPDLVHGGYGAMGNSGGGTQSVMLSAIDPRVKATATSCYLSNMREQTAWRLLADSEQLIHAQLRDGLNHAGYALMGGNPVLMLARRDEMIPFTGTRATFRLLKAVEERLGLNGRFSMYDVPGPHGYCERTMRESVKFLAERLNGVKVDFRGMGDDMGPGAGEAFATKSGKVMDEPGFKSAYEFLREELDAAETLRKAMGWRERAELVRRLADIDERRLGGREVVSEETVGGVRLLRTVFEAEGGYRVPAVELVPAEVKAGPALVVGDGQRDGRLASVRRCLAEGRAVVAADVFATGEIGKTRHHYFNPNDDEETAKMLYLTGSSMVGRRAGEILAIAGEMRQRYGAGVRLIAHGRTAVAAAHAMAAADGLFDGGTEMVDAPPSWAALVRGRRFCDYAVAVHGALLHYDWCDLTVRADGCKGTREF